LPYKHFSAKVIKKTDNSKKGTSNIMRKTNHIFLYFSCLIVLGLLFNTNLTAQKRKPSAKARKKVSAPVVRIYSEVGLVEPEPYLSLEPCAKETPEQIAELENAADKNAQLLTLVKRIGEKDDWLRACSIYRLGEFRNAAQDALPVIIKLLHDEKNDDIWRHAEDALWKIPPDRNIPLAERIRISQNGDVYQRLYAIYSLGYFKPIANTLQAKDTLNALIETAKDEDITIAWLSVMSIRQLGFYGINTSDAIPVLSEILKKGKLNPVNVVRAIIAMGENAFPVVPLLFDILYDPKKYVGEKDEYNRAYILYLTTASALGGIGKPLIPLLEKEIEKHPSAVLEVLGNLRAEGILPIFFNAMKHANAEVRKKAIEKLPGLTSIGAVEALPHLLTAVNDENLEVSQSAMSKIGSIAKYTENKSPELQEILKKKAVPALVAKLDDKKSACYAAMSLGDFGADAEIVIPALVRAIKRNTAAICAEQGLYNIGEKGRKYLTAEKIKQIEESRENTRKMLNDNFNKAKPIKPKEAPKPTPPVTDKET
jgi:HEAT repeat protein